MKFTPSKPLPAFTPRSLIFLAIAVFVVAAASFLGSSATSPSLPVWYPALKKPWFNPPNLAFPIAWTLLFTLMAIGFWRVLRHVDAGEPRRRAVFVFLVHLVVNVSWSFAFFGAQSVGAGLIVAVLLVISVAWVILAFRKVDPVAAWLQMPYLGWVTFAMILNAAIWRLN